MYQLGVIVLFHFHRVREAEMLKVVLENSGLAVTALGGSLGLIAMGD